jgi:hypothetical protein
MYQAHRSILLVWLHPKVEILFPLWPHDNKPGLWSLSTTFFSASNFHFLFSLSNLKV